MHKPILAISAALLLSASPVLAGQDMPPAPPPAPDASPVPPPVPDAPPVTTPEPPAPPAPPPPPQVAAPLPPQPAETMNKEYPVCSATVQDSCVNRSEAPRSALRAPRHRRPG